MTTPKRRRSLWITPHPSREAKAHALALGAKGYEFQFLNSVERLKQALDQRRASVLVVSDEGDEAGTEAILTALMSMPEVQGARLVLAVSRPSLKVAQLAAASNFRDIIPLDLDERTFVTRFVYATAGRALRYVQPAGQIALKNISGLSLPARVTWVSERRLRVESRARPPEGAPLALSGPLAEAFGVPSLTLRVVETQRSHLIYRFSDAILAEWNVPAPLRAGAMTALDRIRAHNTGPRTRAFVAVQTPDLRQVVLQRLDDPRFEVATALQKQSIVEEPRFFTPDLIFIEDALASEDGGERFRAMLANLTGEATVFVLGKLPGLDELQRSHVQHRLVQLPSQPHRLTPEFMAKHLPMADKGSDAHDKDAVHFAPQSPYSLAELGMAARLTRVHPVSAQVALPFPVGNFAVARLESPLVHKVLGRDPYVKITATYTDQHPDAGVFVNLADAYLADVTATERHALAGALTKLMTDTLGRYDQGASFVDARTSGGQVPELGSIKPRIAEVARAEPAAPRPETWTRVETGPAKGRPAAAAAASSPQVAATAGGAAPGADSPEPIVADVEYSPSYEPIAIDPLIAAIAQAQAQAQAAPQVTTTATARAPQPAPEEAPRPLPRPVLETANAAGPKVRRRSTGFGKDVRALLGLALSILLGIGAVWFVKNHLAPNWSRSGGIFTEQLKQLRGGGN